MPAPSGFVVGEVPCSADVVKVRGVDKRIDDLMRGTMCFDLEFCAPVTVKTADVLKVSCTGEEWQAALNGEPLKVKNTTPYPSLTVSAQKFVDVRGIVEALGFDPTNHHNAAKCPYCREGQ